MPAHATFRVPLAAPVIGEEEVALVADVLRSGSLTLGPVLQRFEQRLAELLGSPAAVGCCNGTAALHLALWALDIGPGDEVIVPAYTFPATANVVAMLGASVRFCDVEPGSDVVGVPQLEAAVSERTKAVMPVHLFGMPADAQAIQQWAGDRGIAVVEDAAGAVGSTWANRQVGTFGALGCFSFHPRKTVITGEGGAVIGADQRLIARVRRLRHHGIEDGTFVEVGANYRLSDVNAAIALPQLDRLSELVAERGRLAAEYDRALAAIDGITPPARATAPGARHSWQAYVARLDDPARRPAVIAALAERGVQAQVGTWYVPGLPPWRSSDRGDTPHALASAECGLALPLYPGLSSDQQQHVCESLAAALS